MDQNLEKMLGLKPDIPQIKLRPIESLVSYARNSRTHSPLQVEQIQRSLLEFGWTNPVLADEMGVVAGHGRIMAAEALYKRGEGIRFPNGSLIPIGQIPVVDCTGWTNEQRRAYIIADNKLALNAGWDESLLSLELRELDAIGFDIDVIGFDEKELDALLAEPAPELGDDKDPDAAPDLPDEPACREGDTWILGAHRVQCGDATSLDAWEQLMGGERADVCWSDPPYNVDVGRKNRLIDKTIGGERSATGSIANDKMTEEEFAALLQDTFANLFGIMQPGAAIYVAHSDKAAGTFRQEFEAAGFHFSQMLIWKKNQMVLGVADFQPIHEPIMYGWKKGSRHKWHGGRKQTTVMEIGEGGLISRDEEGRWLIRVGDSVLVVDGEATLSEAPGTIFHEPKPEKSGLHPTQKPVALVERMLKNSARGGDIVVDAFGGSGTTLIAADRLGMCARLMELSPKFADVIIRRWQDYTGRRAVHAVTGEEFPAEGEKRQYDAPQQDDGPDLF
jgi:DNA modification methylase